MGKRHVVVVGGGLAGMASAVWLAELGHASANLTSLFGVFAPAGVPQPVLQRLNAEINRIGQLPQVREKMTVQGIDMLPPEPAAAAQSLVRDDLALWLPIIKASGASAD